MSIDKAIQDKIAAQALKHIDIDSIAKQLAPAIVKEIKNGIVTTINDWDFCDFVLDYILNEKLGNSISKQIEKSILANFKSKEEKGKKK